jgi:hypothetical protein
VIRYPLQCGVGIDELRRRRRPPGRDVSLLPVEGGELAPSFGEHFGRGVDAGDFGTREGIGEDLRQMARTAAEVVDGGVLGLGDAGDEIEAGAKANVGVAEVGLWFPGGHRDRKKSYHRKSRRSRSAITLQLHEEALCAIELHHFEAVFGADFVFHAIEMILDRLFGKREVIRDFLVGESLCDQGD